MNPISYPLALYLGRLSTTQKVGDKVIFADYTKTTPKYTDVTGGQKKPITFQEILNYGTQLGGLAVNIINALKSPPTSGSAGISLTGLSGAEQAAVGDLKAQADAETKRKQRNTYLIGGIALVVIIGATLIFKHNK
ncbi:hypothetical protein [Fibrella aquatilis]|uniref:Uncharacterized protein n=1 Tax=Fibrella aquatilis TaxID=2817059 RepID=A0A939G371_9BACT|nr:hypothetical protein [Fibrella aquatilis]MBO0930358.1 hypothetical protein [Fibrella aquatilis]